MMFGFFDFRMLSSLLWYMPRCETKCKLGIRGWQSPAGTDSIWSPKEIAQRARSPIPINQPLDINRARLTHIIYESHSKFPTCPTTLRI